MGLEDCRSKDGLNPCLILANFIRDNLGILSKRAPELLRDLLEFINDVYDLEIKQFKLDGNSLFEFAYIHVIEPNIHYLYYLVLQCAIPQALYTMRLVIETLMSSAYADIIASIGKEPNPTLTIKLMNYASTFSMNNLVNPPDEFRNYYTQLVRRIEEPLKWLMGRLGLRDGGIINLVYLTYNKLSKLIHPVTKIGNKPFLSGVVIDALLDYDRHGMPSSRHLYAPFECDDTDDAWFKE